MSTSKQSAGRRLSVITVDQVISGASNVLIAVLAARVLSAASFGLFGIVFLIYMILVGGVARALVNDPLLVHPIEAQERPGEVIGTSCLLGLAMGAFMLLAGLGIQIWNTQLGDAMMVLGACIPLLVLQDLGRYIGFATRKPAAALVLDVTWLLLMFVAVAALFATGRRTLPWFIAAWGGSGALAGLLLFTQHSVRQVKPGLVWLRYTWSFSWRYLVSYTTTQGSVLAASSGVGAIAGARALGGVQGAILMTRPFSTFQVAVTAASIGEVSRSPGHRTEVRRHVAKTSVLSTGAALFNVAFMLLLPDRLGRAVLGATWSAAHPLLVATAAQVLCIGLFTGFRAGLLGLRAIRKVMVIDIITTVVILVGSISGAAVNGAKGAIWAIAIGQGVLSLVWAAVFISHTGHLERAPEPEPEPMPAAAPAPAAVMPAVTVPTPPTA